MARLTRFSPRSAGLVFALVTFSGGAGSLLGFDALGRWLGSGLERAAFGQPSANIPNYTPVGQFNLPSGAWDVGPDGRIIQVRGREIWRQDALSGSGFSRIGSLPAGQISGFGASFLSISGDGSRIAIGDNNFNASASVYVVDTAGLSSAADTPTMRIISGNFDGTWDGNTLYITGADAATFNSQLYRVNFNAPGTPIAETVLRDIGLGSGGVAVWGGRLFTGTGYGSASQPTGQIRSFDIGTLGAPGNPLPAPFSVGTLVATTLSASPLGFDRAGNLLAGGGDNFGGTTDIGYAAVIDPANPDPAAWLRLSPGPMNILYSAVFNAATDELLVVGGGTAYRYAIPTPAGAAVLALGGAVALRRRRKLK